MSPFYPLIRALRIAKSQPSVSFVQGTGRQKDELAYALHQLTDERGEALFSVSMVTQLGDVPVGSMVIANIDNEGLRWLNLRRNAITDRKLRLILWADQPLNIPALAQDLDSWIRIKISLPTPLIPRLGVLKPYEYHYLNRLYEHWAYGDPGALLKLRPNTIFRRDRQDILLYAEQKLHHRQAYLDQILSHPDYPRSVVVGSAGMGKTVLLQHIAWVLASYLLDRPLAPTRDEPPHQLDLSALQGQQNHLPIPILITAQELAETLRQDTKNIIEQAFKKLICKNIDITEQEVQLGSGRYLFLIDALDEVPNLVHRQALIDALGTLENSNLRVVLSTRPMASMDVLLPVGFKRVDIAALNEEQIEHLTRTFLKIQGQETQMERALQAIRAFQLSISSDTENHSPTENPLLLTALLVVFLAFKSLPDDQAELYRALVQLLCIRRVQGQNEREVTENNYREYLQSLFFAMQEAGGTRLLVRDAIQVLLKHRYVTTAPQATTLLEEIANQTGLLRFERQDGQWVICTWHRSFQAYLAAHAVVTRFAGQPELAVAWLEAERAGRGCRVLDATWAECLHFLPGVFEETRHAVAWMESWVNAAQRAGVAGNLALEARWLSLASAGVAAYAQRHFRDSEVWPRLQDQIASRFAVVGAEWPLWDRLDVLEGLGRLGDVRWADPWLAVARGWGGGRPGRYPVGGGDKILDSLPLQEVETSGFFMRRWPVTVAEFGAFVEAEGYAQNCWWQDGRGEDETEPQNWYQQQRKPNRPVVGISWFTARAFCRWATHHWKLPMAGILDLPTSKEWEVAARRGTGRGYPWGNDAPEAGDKARAAYNWEGTPFRERQGVPVGAFPLGHTPEVGEEGPLWDMAGTVWEWCATVVDDEEMDCQRVDKVCQDDNVLEKLLFQKCLCILRGGSWLDNARGLRAAYRDWNRPKYHNNSLGFRVLIRVPDL